MSPRCQFPWKNEKLRMSDLLAKSNQRQYSEVNTENVIQELFGNEIMNGNNWCVYGRDCGGSGRERMPRYQSVMVARVVAVVGISSRLQWTEDRTTD
ncbi:uncharacterized protein YALI1_F05313g [Yarrowia lipolytica]|uniref:Uncharacterized protein n=1 Tax=Yarrowia lipolytica TaxID=4952 RepID=A0A1D8NLU6_YARLL|nr:hypothetical protein YALI1_F05313g [Yarrowia lipolytica]